MAKPISLFDGLITFSTGFELCTRVVVRVMVVSTNPISVTLVNRIIHPGITTRWDFGLDLVFGGFQTNSLVLMRREPNVSTLMPSNIVDMVDVLDGLVLGEVNYLVHDVID